MQRKFLLASYVDLRLIPGLIVIFVALFSSDSFAARDAGQMVTQDKSDKEASDRTTAESDRGADSGNEVLPLDHGPRATTTPWLNQQRRLKAQAAASAAKNAKSAGATIYSS
jgi:hypothetical protein